MKVFGLLLGVVFAVSLVAISWGTRTMNRSPDSDGVVLVVLGTIGLVGSMLVGLGVPLVTAIFAWWFA